MVRFGKPSKQTADQIVAQLDAHFPAKTYEMNWLLCETLAFLEAPTVAKKGNISSEESNHAGGTNGVCPVSS